MKRFLFVLAISVAAVCSLQAGPVNEAEARQVADNFFSQDKYHFATQAGTTATRLAYVAEHERFFVFDRGARGGFVVVAGDDRLPQVLAHGASGDFSQGLLPDAVRYWLNEMNRQIAFLQSHDDVAAHVPAKRAQVVEPLLSTQWDQDVPYNNYCPTYTLPNGDINRAVTGCVATATAQVMNYYQWPDVGVGSHSYTCNVNNMTVTELSADYSQSVYRWDLMLDRYDASSSAESCDAVARLMSDVGISVDMGYGSSSGASEYAASQALKRYFKYANTCYWLNRDYYSAAEWDELMVAELSARRPVMYCGYAFDGGHAFVLDGVDAKGYYHVNWGWGGNFDGYFLVSVLAPTSGMDFKYMQDGLFGLVPDYRAGEVDKVLYIRSQMIPLTQAVPLGNEVSLNIDQLIAEGNALDTAGYDIDQNGRKRYYSLIHMSLDAYNETGLKFMGQLFDYKHYLNGWGRTGQNVSITLPERLNDGEYKLKLAYSLEDGNACDQPVYDYSGKEVYVKMLVRNDTAYLSDCFLYNTYSLESMIVQPGVTIGQPFDISVSLSYNMPWTSGEGPLGNVYLSMIKDGQEVAVSDMYEIQVPAQSVKTFEMQMTAPEEWGRYYLVLHDESDNQIVKFNMWEGVQDDSPVTFFVLPVCQSLVEDFETMTANNKTNEKNVPGRFTTWSFNKSGVRAPGETLCNGTNAVMMKNPSTISSTQPLHHDFFLAQASFFNQSSSLAKYALEYSVDGAAPWHRVNTIDSLELAEVPSKSQALATWVLDVPASQPTYFRIAMIGGGSSAATYVDDIIFYYTDVAGDVNHDGEINIADVNAIINAILTLTTNVNTDADVNGDGEVNIADVNAVIRLILD